MLLPPLIRNGLIPQPWSHVTSKDLTEPKSEAGRFAKHSQMQQGVKLSQALDSVAQHETLMQELRKCDRKFPCTRHLDIQQTQPDSALCCVPPVTCS